ncbi:MAG: RING finger domain-containing protein [Flavobacterium sp.]
MPCGICRRTGHNSRTCPSELALPVLFDAETIARFRLPRITRIDTTDEDSLSDYDITRCDELYEEHPQEQSLECIVCCDEIGDEMVKIKCGHTYCVSCFVKDMRQRGTCAMCRADICEAPPKKTLSRNTRADIIDQWLDNSQQTADMIRADFIEQMRASIDRSRIIRTNHVNELEQILIQAAISTNLTVSLWNAGISASEYTSYWYETDV